jgi:two-component system sensor histidine kinase/response regulator
VDSAEGAGSTFWITARLGLALASELAATTAAGNGSGVEALQNRRGARLLLVEDNELNQLVATELLRDAGFVVDVADHGGMALERLRAADAQPGGPPYALILMDIQMPVMDGIEATLRIRDNPRWRNIPVVAMTANAMEGDSARCLAAGMVDFVGKPIEPAHLWATLARWVPPQAPLGSSAPQALPVPPDADADAVDPPAAIDGLNVLAGLRRVQHIPVLYRRLLQSFVQAQAGAPALIRAAVQQGHGLLAERTAHTLKGVAGSIGAETVAATAEQLEMAIHLGLATDRIAH